MRAFLHKKDDGFTLIELLIVIAILAILVSIVAISFGDIMTDTEATVMKEELRLVQLTIDRYNSWDVFVLGAADIPANGTATKVSSTTAGAPFGKYLSNESHYCYTWAAKGASLANSKCPASP